MTSVFILSVALLVASALFTAVGSAWIERRYPPCGRFVRVRGGQMHVLELGRSERRPAILLLHGSTTNLNDMKLALGETLATDHRVILIDRPGHGWSDRPDGDLNSTPFSQEHLIAEALDQMGIRQVLIVAHSWSAAVATTLATSMPERVAGLVLCSPVALPKLSTIPWLLRMADTPVVGWVLARTFVLPMMLPALAPVARHVFAPQPLPHDYIRLAAVPMALRPKSSTQTPATSNI